MMDALVCESRPQILIFLCNLVTFTVIWLLVSLEVPEYLSPFFSTILGGTSRLYSAQIVTYAPISHVSNSRPFNTVSHLVSRTGIFQCL